MLMLNQARYLSLATFRKNGLEVRTPVWFAQENESIYLFSSGDAGKVKRLRNSSRARVAPCDVRGRVLGEWQEAEALLLNDAAEIERAHRALRKKYGLQMVVLDFFAGIFGRAQRRVFIVLRVHQ